MPPARHSPPLLVGRGDVGWGREAAVLGPDREDHAEAACSRGSSPDPPCSGDQEQPPLPSGALTPTPAPPRPWAEHVQKEAPPSARRCSSAPAICTGVVELFQAPEVLVRPAWRGNHEDASPPPPPTPAESGAVRGEFSIKVTLV